MKKKSPIYTVDQLRAHSERDPTSNCWIWKWGLSRGEPSILTINYSTGHKQALRGALAVWHIAYQRSTNGRFAVRTCSNLLCVCPSHVRLADTRQEVMRVRVALGIYRQPGFTAGRGEALQKAWSNRLLPKDLVRRVYLHPSTNGSAIARELGLHKSVVWLIRNGWRRRDVTARIDEELAHELHRGTGAETGPAERARSTELAA